MSGAVVAVTQWLVARLTIEWSLLRIPFVYRIACVFRIHNKPSVPSIMVSMMGEVNIGVDAAKAACWSTRDREARRLELTPGSDSVGTQFLTSLLTSMHFCVRTVIAHQCLLRPLLNC